MSRVVTPNGRLHLLMTSPADDVAYPAAEFADFHHACRRIEETFKRIKHIQHLLALATLSGITWLAAPRDFGADV